MPRVGGPIQYRARYLRVQGPSHGWIYSSAPTGGGGTQRRGGGGVNRGWGVGWTVKWKLNRKKKKKKIGFHPPTPATAYSFLTEGDSPTYYSVLHDIARIKEYNYFNTAIVLYNIQFFNLRDVIEVQIPYRYIEIFDCNWDLYINSCPKYINKWQNVGLYIGYNFHAVVWYINNIGYIDTRYTNLYQSLDRHRRVLILPSLTAIWG